MVVATNFREYLKGEPGKFDEEQVEGGALRFVWRIAHLWWVRCKWKWTKQRQLCGLEAVKYQHVGADDAMLLMAVA